MALTYTCGKDVIGKALVRLKQDGLVSANANFNYDAPGGFRKEVAYRDFDFLTRLSRTAEDETAATILGFLIKTGIVPDEAQFDRNAFHALKAEVEDNFSIPGTSITPVMERLLYLLSSLKRPQQVIGLGTYCGYALVWAAGANFGKAPLYSARQVVGVDIDEHATRQAGDNFSRLANSDHVVFVTEDGLEAVEWLPGPFDYVYLDVESVDSGKGLYLELVQRLYDKIEKGGWVLAHDTAAPPFADQLEGYLSFTRDGRQFKESLSFDVDPFGLELSLK